VTILLDTGATHCFICARLVAALDPKTLSRHGERARLARRC
jgi:hypothetical protein